MPKREQEETENQFFKPAGNSTAAWEQKFKAKIDRVDLTAPEKNTLKVELDRTAQYLREIGHYDAGPESLALSVDVNGELVSGYELRRKFFYQAKTDILSAPTK